jgi:hypothetical protein
VSGLPAQIADIAYQNKAAIYGILFKASAETMLTIAGWRGNFIGLRPAGRSLNRRRQARARWCRDGTLPHEESSA